MDTSRFISIDQNCHPLWDTIPKLEVLAAKGRTGVHCIEDIDVAFSRQGATPGDTELALMRERYYRGGHSDWGAALFCHDFLGRLPVDVRSLEPYTGMTTAALSRLLDTTVDGLYERWSASDNWQLVGASYSADPAWHRVIGDVTLEEAGPFVLELLQHAREDLLARFPEETSQRDLNDWLDHQEALVRDILRESPQAALPHLYNAWMQPWVPENTTIRLTSERFGLEHTLDHDPLLRLFLERYDGAADAYNAALEQTDVGMAPLHKDQGELPFFAIRRNADGGMVRCPMEWADEQTVVAAECSWRVRDGMLPVDAMRSDGIVAVAGKALLLVLQVRVGNQGAPLALPHMGSLYMPAAHAFERILREQNLLRTEAHPVLRVRLRFLEHMARYETVVRPPPYLAEALDLAEAPACDLGEALNRAMEDAETTLKRLSDDDAREKAVKTKFADRVEAREALESRRREIVRDPERRDEAKAMWQDVKAMDRDLAEAQAEWALQLHRILDVRYYDSRGALLPWCLALGGETCYRQLVDRAEVVAVTAEHEVEAS